MKKTLGLMIALVALSLGGVCFAQSAVNSQRDQVTFAVNVLAGDEAAAEGLVVESRNHLNGHLFWNTAYAPGTESVVQTDYTFSPSPVYDQRVWANDSVSLSNNVDWDWNMADAEGVEPVGLAIAYQELMDETAPGEEKTKVIALKDYYDYYPIQAAINLPNRWLDTSILSSMRGENWTDEELEALDRAFTGFFKIPILDGGDLDEQYELMIQKNSSGNGSSSSLQSLNGDTFFIYSYSAALADACYFVFDAHTTQGNLADTSQIAGGFGIYRLPYELDEGGTATVNLEGLSTAYPLDPAVSIQGLHANGEKTKLLLCTLEDKTYVMTVIDGKTMETLQRLEVADARDGAMYYSFIYDDFIVLGLSNSLVLITLTEEESYRVQFTAELGADFPLYNYMDGSDVSLAWDGERLAIADNRRMESRWREECGFYLVIYDGDGQMLYAGEYPSSLSVGDSDGWYSSSFHCSPRENTPITVRWDKQ